MEVWLLVVLPCLRWPVHCLMILRGISTGLLSSREISHYRVIQAVSQMDDSGRASSTFAAFDVVASGGRSTPFLLPLLLAISLVEKIPHRTPTPLRGISIGPLPLMEVSHPRVIQQSAEWTLPTGRFRLGFLSRTTNGSI